MRSMFNYANIAASTKSANILAGDINEFVTQRSQVTLYGVSSAAGVKITLLASSDVAIDDKEIVNINTTLAIPDAMVDSFVVAPNTRLSLTYRETAASATTDIAFAIDVTPV